MDAVGNAVSALVAVLRPAGLWYVVLTTAVVLFAWFEQGTAWADWPVPLAWATWVWLVVTALCPLYLLVAPIVQYFTQQLLTKGLPPVRADALALPASVEREGPEVAEPAQNC